MSGPQNAEPTRPWSPPPEPQGQSGPDEPTSETPWWQQVRRRQPATPSYPEPQQQAAPQASYPPPPYAQPPAQYGPAPSRPAKHTARWLLIAGGVLVGVVAAVVLVVVLLSMDVLGGKELSVNKAQEGVKQVITDSVAGYGIDNVTTVTCNGGENPTAKKGDTFTCEVTVDGKKQHVRAIFVDDNGTYEVDRPR